MYTFAAADTLRESGASTEDASASPSANFRSSTRLTAIADGDESGDVQQVDERGSADIIINGRTHPSTAAPSSPTTSTSSTQPGAGPSSLQPSPQRRTTPQHDRAYVPVASAGKLFGHKQVGGAVICI